MGSNKYRNISLNRELIDFIEVYIRKNPEYRSIADFVREALRLRLEQLKTANLLKDVPKLD